MKVPRTANVPTAAGSTIAVRPHQARVRDSQYRAKAAISKMMAAIPAGFPAPGPAASPRLVSAVETSG